MQADPTPPASQPLAETLVLAGCSAIPVVGGPAVVLLGAYFDRRQARVQHFANELTNAVSEEDLRERVGDDEFVDLLVRAGQLAAGEHLAWKRRAMADAIACVDAPREPTAHAEALLSALDAMLEPDAVALANLADADGRVLLDAPVMRLVAHGVAEVVGTMGGPAATISDFGLELHRIVVKAQQ